MSFFSFQDIIACTTGILVVVTLCLMIQLTQRRTAEQKAGGPRVDMKTLQARVKETKQQKDSLGKQLEETNKEVGNLASKEEISDKDILDAKDQRNSLEKRVKSQKGRRQDVKEKRKRLEKDLRNAKSEEEELRSDLAKEQQVKHEKKKEKTPKILLEGADESGKTPIFVELNARAIHVGEYNKESQEVRRTQTFSDAEEFLAWTRARDASKECFCLEVKPKGVEHWEPILDDLKKNGFDVGWDVLPADRKFFSNE